LSNGAGDSVLVLGTGGVSMFEEVLDAMTVNSIKPIIDKTFEFKDAAAAYKYQMEGKHFGKIVN
jgi:NADPH:quinone reductase-like Zn-dependent oxidoreductase